jgi:site-specific DNA-methyltransferase (adenine-specific)/adenine-specific DNA-methyltransferase
MPSLNWIGKSAVVAHHKQVPFRLLKCRADLSVGDPQAGNLLVQGDNLEALKALLPYYAGQVKCIYIDPPYNTGNEDWAYNDAVNSPEIRDWLGKAVGGEAEDLSRHDKWLCMMYPRLQILTQFLTPDGFLLVSLDEIELARFRLMMEEILSPSQYIATLIWKSRRNLDNRSLHNVSIDHEFVVAYRMGTGAFRGASKDMEKYSNPDNDPRGPWMSDNLVGLATKERRPNLHYDLVNPNTGDIYPCSSKGWRYSKETMAQKISEGRIIWPAKKNGRPRHKKFASDLQSEFAGFSSFVECGNTNEGTEEMMKIMGQEQFIFPKPRSLVETLLEQTTLSDDIILDAFAGTGTTGHAVLSLNRKDGVKRRFILVEINPNIAPNITAERLKRVIRGYTFLDQKGIEKSVPGLGGGFRFCELGATLFDAGGQIRPEVAYDDLAQHIFFIETGSPLPRPEQPQYPLLGVHNGTAVYLLYNGVLKDKSPRVHSEGSPPRGGNVLTLPLLATLPEHFGLKIIYGTGCRIGEHRLRELGIVFKQIPYEIRER